MLTHQYEGWARDETSNVLNPIPLPSHISPAPKDVMKMVRCGCSSTQPCSTTRCRFQLQDCLAPCFVTVMQRKNAKMIKQNMYL